MIAVTFALPAEGRDFLKLLSRRGTRRMGDLSVRTGRIGDTEIEILHTGVGIGVAERRLRTYLAGSSPEYLIAAGFAGGTRSDQRVGEIILGDNYSDPALLGEAERKLRSLTVRRGNIFTAPEVVDTLAARTELWQRESVIGVEMETRIIAAVAGERGIPVLALRSVSDTPEHPFPLPPAILFDVSRQRTLLRRLAGHLVANPRALPRLIRFSRQIATARRALADALLLSIRARHESPNDLN